MTGRERRREMIQMLRDGSTYSAVAAYFGVSPQRVAQVVGDAVPPRRPRGDIRKQQMTAADRVDEFLRLLHDAGRAGLSRNELNRRNFTASQMDELERLLAGQVHVRVGKTGHGTAKRYYHTDHIPGT